MDTLHAQLFTGFDVLNEIIDEDRFFCLDLKLLQRDVIDLRIRLCHTHLRRDDHVVENIVELFADDVIA